MKKKSTAASSKLISRRALIKATGATAVASTGLYSTFFEPSLVEYTRVPLTIPTLPKSFQNFKIVHLSDLHYDSGYTADWLPEITTTINSLQADLVLITGDFITHSPALAQSDLAQELKRIKSKHGLFAVPGNHDHWTDIKSVRRMMELAHITDLSNRVVKIEQGNEVIQLCGVDDVLTGNDNLQKLLKQKEKGICSILLAHEPDFADMASGLGNFDLQLSGHSHGGQVRMPLWGPILLPPMAEKYPMGLYKVNNMLLYTTRGVGCLPPMVRFNCRPEVTVMTLSQAQA